MTLALFPEIILEYILESEYSTKTKEVMVRFFIESRPGVSGGEVTWEQMARHLDIRTLAFYGVTHAFVLWGRLPLEECVNIARFLL